MNNYTTEVAQIKRNSFNFTNKISKGSCKPIQKLCQDMIYGIKASKSVLLTDISRALKEKIKLAYTVDRISTNLNNLDKEQKEILQENYINQALNNFSNEGDYVIVLNDDSDINHEQAKKMEDLCLVRDASSKQEKYVNGYKVCEYVGLSRNMKSPISLYSHVYSTVSKDFISENDETIKGENQVIEYLKRINKKPLFVRDRGYDAKEYLIKDIKEDNKFITRLKTTRNLIFKNKSENCYEHVLNGKGKIKTKLMYKGENKDCYISYTRVKLPAYKKKEITLVTVYGLSEEKEEKVMQFLTNVEVKNKDDAEKIVRTYFLRWRIEEYFKSKKQNYKWESSLMRTLDGINNLNMFLTIVMLELNEYIEKIKTNFLSNIILERAKQLKEKCIIYFGQISQGIYEILKLSHTGIRKYEKIKHTEKYQQLKLSI